MIDYNDLSEKSKKIRKKIIDMIYSSNSGYPGGALSCVELITALYFGRMNIDVEDPSMPERDRFVMSKGHSSPALYATLCEKGFLLEEKLSSYRKIHGALQGSPDMNRVSGVDMSSGSLGMGLSAACGMALASKIEGINYNVYALLGDGELQEGMIWEAVMFANQYKLDNLMAIIDFNGLQINGKVDEVISLGSLTKKFTSFGWYVIEIDGHDFDQIFGAFNIFDKVDSQPILVIANTVKGKGISFMENDGSWHRNKFTKELYKAAMDELR